MSNITIREGDFLRSATDKLKIISLDLNSDVILVEKDSGLRYAGSIRSVFDQIRDGSIIVVSSSAKKQVPKNGSKQKICDCDFDDIMAFGCKCGGV